MLFAHLTQIHGGKHLSVLENSKWESQFCLKNLTPREKRNKKETWPFQTLSPITWDKPQNKPIASGSNRFGRPSFQFCSAVYLLCYGGKVTTFLCFWIFCKVGRTLPPLQRYYGNLLICGQQALGKLRKHFKMIKYDKLWVHWCLTHGRKIQHRD